MYIEQIWFRSLSSGKYNKYKTILYLPQQIVKQVTYLVHSTVYLDMDIK